MFEVDISKVYFDLAIKVVNHLKLPCKAGSLDGIRLHVDSRYNSDGEEDDEELHCLNICKGYSRNHRPDLNPVILLLLTENKAGIALFMAGANGNVTDKTRFKKMVTQHLKSFRFLMGSGELTKQHLHSTFTAPPNDRIR